MFRAISKNSFLRFNPRLNHTTIIPKLTNLNADSMKKLSTNKVVLWTGYFEMISSLFLCISMICLSGVDFSMEEWKKIISEDNKKDSPSRNHGGDSVFN